MFNPFHRVSRDELLAALAEAVPAAAGDAFLSLIHYGPGTSEATERAPGPASVQVLIVLKSLELEHLDALAESLQELRGKEAIAPMVLSLEELVASTDVFPITFTEMKRQHRLLAGKNVLERLPIHDVHLRLRCEQELKNLLLRMQSAYLLQNHRPAQLLETLRLGYAGLLRCLRAASRLAGEAVVDSEADAVAFGVEQFGLDHEVLTRTQEMCDSEPTVGAEAIAAVFGGLLIAVHNAASAVDALEAEEVVLLEGTEGEGVAP